MQTLKQSRDKDLSLIVIDEAHHGAASTYKPVINQKKCSVISLTATPNRTDNAEIGIDKISYQTSYRELFKRNCIIEPTFEEPVYISDGSKKVTYNNKELCDELAEYVLERTNNNLKKCLICVTMKDYAENIYDAIKEKHSSIYGHRLDSTQIQFVHGSKNSMEETGTENFLKIFSGEKNGILIATQSLIGEGFDDPNIDSVFITYKSNSISQLMQVGGRALRYSEGKRKASIIQVHQSPLAYHFNNRWLYQDITDYLRPRLDDKEYSSNEERTEKLDELLNSNNVPTAEIEKINHQVSKIPLTENFRILLIGYEHYDQNFDTNAEFKPLVITNQEFQRFKDIFNTASYAEKETRIIDTSVFLKAKNVKYEEPIWKDYADMIWVLGKAREEIKREIGYEDRRNYSNTSSEGTTWLKYINFSYSQKNAELNKFLDDCLNKKEVLEEFSQGGFHSLVKIFYPIHGSKVFLLKEKQFRFIENLKLEIINNLKEKDMDQFLTVQKIKNEKKVTEVPFMVMEQVNQLLREESLSKNFFILEK